MGKYWAKTGQARNNDGQKPGKTGPPQPGLMTGKALPTPVWPRLVYPAGARQWAQSFPSWGPAGHAIWVDTLSNAKKKRK